MEQEIKYKHILTFHQYVKYLITFGCEYNKPFISIEGYCDDLFNSLNPKNKNQLDRRLRSYFQLATSGNLIELKPTAKCYSEVVELTEFGARYLLNVKDHIKSSLLSGAIGAIASAILTAVISIVLNHFST